MSTREACLRGRTRSLAPPSRPRRPPRSSASHAHKKSGRPRSGPHCASNASAGQLPTTPRAGQRPSTRPAVRSVASEPPPKTSRYRRRARRSPMPRACPFSAPSEQDFQFSAELLGCVLALANFAACHDSLNVARMLGSPLAKRSQRPSQGSPESREGIFDLRGYLSEIDTIDDPVRLQFLELLNQHFVAYVADCAS